MKSHFVEDLLKLGVGNTFQSPFRLSGAERRTRKNGQIYLTLRLLDRTGSVDAKWWDCTDDHCKTALCFRYADVTGTIQQFGGRKEVHLQAEPTWLQEPEDSSPYEIAAPLPFVTLQRRLTDHIQSLQNHFLKTLLTGLFGDSKFRLHFDEAPAAQYRHHAFRHGLLQHTLEVADLTVRMAEAQTSWGYRPVSRDLALAGALLHDIGKVDELTWTGDGEFGATRRGQMLGHVVIGLQRLSKEMNKIEAFPPALKDALMHIVVSHHGKKEFGAPVTPLFPEAQIVHIADLLDTQLFYMQEAAAAATQEFVQVPKLDKQLLYTLPWDDLVSKNESEVVAVKAVPALIKPPQSPQQSPMMPLLPANNSLPIFQFRTTGSSQRAGSSPSFVTRRIPLIGQAAAGLPITAEEHIEDVYEVEAEHLPLDRKLFLLSVSGDSMTGDGIADGDMVLVVRQERPEPNAILVTYLADRDEAAIKRISQTVSGEVQLLSSNPAYLPISVVDPTSLQVRGKVLGIVRHEMDCTP